MTTPDDFDPNTVPPFPVLTIRESADGPDTLDGVPIEPAHGQDDRKRAAVAAAAAKAQDLGHDAVRVAVHGVGGERFDMVVRANGQPYDTTPSQEPAAPPRRRRSLLLAAGALVTVVLVLAAFLGARFIAEQTPTPEPVADTSTPPPGAGTEVPAGLPPGFEPTAAWTAAVEDGSSAKRLADGRILTLNPDGSLNALDATTGEKTWMGTGAPSELETVAETIWQGRPVLATAQAQRLTLWPLDTTPATPVHVDLQAPADVSFAGDAPLIDLGDYTVLAPATPDADARRLALPAGAKPAAITEGIVSAITADSITTTDIATGEYDEQPFTPPAGSTGTPQTVLGLDGTHALASWDGEDGDIVALIDLTTGAALATTSTPGGLRPNDVPLRDQSHHTAVVGDLFVSYDPADARIVPMSGFTPTALHDTTVYGEARGSLGTLTIVGEEPAFDPYELLSPDDPSPTLITDDAGWIVITTVDQTTIYRTDRTAKEQTP